MRSSLILVSLISTFTAASQLVDRAGGPIAKPIPANCTVINPLPHANCGTANVNGFKPEPSFVKANLLFQSYFLNGLSPVEEAKECKQQCFGFGNPGECKSSFVAFEVPTPAGFEGAKGGELQTACLLFNQFLDPPAFVAAKEGHYVNATAADIFCPK